MSPKLFFIRNRANLLHRRFNRLLDLLLNLLALLLRSCTWCGRWHGNLGAILWLGAQFRDRAELFLGQQANNGNHHQKPQNAENCPHTIGLTT